MPYWTYMMVQEHFEIDSFSLGLKFITGKWVCIIRTISKRSLIYWTKNVSVKRAHGTVHESIYIRKSKSRKVELASFLFNLHLTPCPFVCEMATNSIQPSFIIHCTFGFLNALLPLMFHPNSIFRRRICRGAFWKISTMTVCMKYEIIFEIVPFFVFEKWKW